MVFFEDKMYIILKVSSGGPNHHTTIFNLDMDQYRTPLKTFLIFDYYWWAGPRDRSQPALYISY